MPSTVVHALLPAICATITQMVTPIVPRVTSRASKMQWFKIALFAVVFGNIPDLDIIPAALLPSQWSDIHREWGHNIFALIFFVIIGVKVLRRFVAPALSTRRAVVFCTLVVGSHLVLDASMGYLHEEMVRPGVPLFFPFSKVDFSMPWMLFDCWKSTSHPHPLVAYAFQPTNWKVYVLEELRTTTLLALGWSGVLAYLWLMQIVIRRVRLFLSEMTQQH